MKTLTMKTLTVMTLMVMSLGAAIAVAEDRLAVLEFFGRPHGAYCSAAGPAMIALQDEMDGRAVLLEYDFDAFPSGRVDRWWESGGSAQYLPLVMVGSGYRTTSGSEDYYTSYCSLLDAELARPARAAVTAYQRQLDNRLRFYVHARNLETSDISVAEEAAIWVITWENAPIGVSTTWVRSAVRWPLQETMAPGEVVTAVIETPQLLNLSRMAGLALLEDRPGGSGRYDLLQAAKARPASLLVSPDYLVLSPMHPAAELVLSGPHVLTWSATPDVSCLHVTPAGGALPATVTVKLLSEMSPRSACHGTITIQAAGDGMAFSATVSVATVSPVRRAGRRLRPQE